MSDSFSNNHRIAKNTIFLYVRMIITTVIGLYTSRAVLEALGVVDYGIYNVVGGVVSMFGFINVSMSSGTQRYLTYSIGKEQIDDTLRVFNTAIIIHIIVAIIIFIMFETIGLWLMNTKLVIPQERLLAANWIFQASVFSALIMIVSVPYDAIIVAKEHMSAFAYISIFEVLLRLAIVICLFFFNYDRLILYAILTVFVQISIRICYGMYCNRNFRESKFQWIWDKKLFFEMIKFSMWTINGTIAYLGSIYGLNILLNMYFGPIVNAARGVAQQVQDKVNMFSLNIQLAMAPQITKTYANGNFDAMHNLIIMSSKSGFFMLLVLSLPIVINIHPILNVWLVEVPQYTEPFVVLCLLASMIRCLAGPLLKAIHATGDIKFFQMAEGTLLLMVLPFVWIAVEFFHVSPVIAMSLYLIIEVCCQIIRILIVLPRIHMAYSKYVLNIAIPIISCSVIACILPIVLLHFLVPDTFFSFVIETIVSVICVILSVYFVGCSKTERSMIVVYLRKLVKKK